MEIRLAEGTDTSEIVDLLKISLGESLMPKSEAFWNWKHVDNPFGTSPVLLALENDVLIGVRAFMRWEWKQGKNVYKAIRAVDTATHPSHQGKGIFKKLTLQLVDQCKAEDVDFVFNTPNKLSKPGYLKMGWKSRGKMNLKLKPVFRTGGIKPDFDEIYLLKPEIFKIAKNFVQNSEALQTHVTERFLEWRYGMNPTIKYNAITDNITYITIFRLKPHRFGAEFRICDSFHVNEVDMQQYRNHLKNAVNASGAAFISASENTHMSPSLTIPIGPEITVRTLSGDHDFLPLNFWRPSLGDMEVF